jgi:hypothetical protein
MICPGSRLHSSSNGSVSAVFPDASPKPLIDSIGDIDHGRLWEYDDAALSAQQQPVTTHIFEEQTPEIKLPLSHRELLNPVPKKEPRQMPGSTSNYEQQHHPVTTHYFREQPLELNRQSSQLRRLTVLHSDVGRSTTSRCIERWAKIRSRVVKGVNLTGLIHTLRAMHSRSLIYIGSYDGFALPSDAVNFVIQHSKMPGFEPFWLDAHCLSEEDARRLQRAFGFHSKTESLLFSRMDDASRYDREVPPVLSCFFMTAKS